MAYRFVRCGLVASALVTGGCIDWDSLSPRELACPANFRQGAHTTTFDEEPQGLFSSPGVLANIDGGALVVELARNVVSDAYGGIELESIDARNRVFRTHLLDVPNTANGETALGIVTPDRSEIVALAFVAGSGVHVTVRNASGTTNTMRAPLDALWFQLDTTNDAVSFQTSTDGDHWDQWDTLTPGPAFIASANLLLQSGTWAAASAPGRASFDFLLECEPSP
jgi:hypothetical protein